MHREIHGSQDAIPATSERCHETLADKIAQHQGALTAADLSRYLCTSKITIFRLAERGVLPPFRIAGCARFCPAAIARWLRQRGG